MSVDGMDGSRLIVTISKSEAGPEDAWDLSAAGGKLSGTQKTASGVAKVAGVRAPALKREPPKAWTKFRAVTKTFGDFKLHLEFNIPEGENSGIYLRGRDEVQVANPSRGTGRAAPPLAKGDGHRNPAGSLGSVYGFLLFPLKDPQGSGDWQTYDITLVGRKVTVVLNGFMGIDNQEIQGITGGALDSNEEAPGPIHFQGDHHGGIRYRNITISVPKR